MNFKLQSEYTPTGDQPQAIREITDSFRQGDNAVTLWGVTGSGKTFTMANVIERMNRPTLVLSHNKTLAGQLFAEFKGFFPDNAVEYFVSYYDYYQPEAYIPQSDTYIEKDLAINDEIEKLRLSTATTLLSGRRDVVVVSSVSCLYGIGNPSDFHENTIEIEVGKRMNRIRLFHRLTDALYNRSEIEFKRGTFRVKGDTVDIYVAYDDKAYRILFFDDEIEEIFSIDPVSGSRIDRLNSIKIFPANNFVTTRQRIDRAVHEIQDDLTARLQELESLGKTVESKRLKSRVEYDLEMIKEVGYCSGIENYSRYFDGRSAGSRPFCLIDYFPKDYLMIIDESHVTIPQIRAMYGGDFSRKTNLVDYGFRLPSALDNRPLKFEEFERLTGQVLYVSATPAEYELCRCEGVVVEQFIRPTGLLDPTITVLPIDNQIDRVVEEIHKAVKEDERVMITTLTKRMAEELTKYLENIGIRCRYIHSDIDTLERIVILDDFCKGLYDVLIGVNLLREGLDMPEVALVIIMDADKEGFLRSSRSLTQTVGRAARNVNGRVLMFADKITDAMRQTIAETESRRRKQELYNKEHGIVPQQIVKDRNDNVLARKEPENETEIAYYDLENTTLLRQVADGEEVFYEAYDPEKLKALIDMTRQKMEEAAKELDFAKATEYRDKMYALQRTLAKLPR